jgi:hypothetical protein
LNWPVIGANKPLQILVSTLRHEERLNVSSKMIGARGIVGAKIRKP